MILAQIIYNHRLYVLVTHCYSLIPPQSIYRLKKTSKREQEDMQQSMNEVCERILKTVDVDRDGRCILSLNVYIMCSIGGQFSRAQCCGTNR